MNKSFIITSILDPEKTPLTYSKTRSFFSPDQRVEQTLCTISKILPLKNSEDEIYLLDASKDKSLLSSFSSLPIKIINIEEKIPEIFNLIRTHKNKSFCECTMLVNFLKIYANELLKFDYIIKLSGRYYIEFPFSLNLLLNESNINKIFYKTPNSYEWQDWWDYNMVDLRAQQQDNCLRQYSSVMYGWGRLCNNEISKMLEEAISILENPNLFHYDIETLSYFLTRSTSSKILELEWTVCGRDGCSGRLVRY